MATGIKVTDLVAKLKHRRKVVAPDTCNASAKLARLLRYPDLLDIELRRHMSNVTFAYEVENNIVVSISRSRMPK